MIDFTEYRKDPHYSTKNGVKSAGRAVQSVRGVGWVEPIRVRVRQSKCLEFIKTNKKKKSRLRRCCLINMQLHVSVYFRYIIIGYLPKSGMCGVSYFEFV